MTLEAALASPSPGLRKLVLKRQWPINCYFVPIMGSMVYRLVVLGYLALQVVLEGTGRRGWVPESIASLIIWVSTYCFGQGYILFLW